MVLAVFYFPGLSANSFGIYFLVFFFNDRRLPLKQVSAALEGAEKEPGLVLESGRQAILSLLSKARVGLSRSKNRTFSQPFSFGCHLSQLSLG